MQSEVSNVSSPQPPARTTPDHASLVNQLIDPIVIFDKQGKPRFTNPAARKLLAGSLAARLAAHLHTESTRRAVLQVRFPLDAGGTVILRISRKHITWEGESAVLVSLHNVTPYIHALQDRKNAFEQESRELSAECERLRADLRESEKAGEDLKSSVASLKARIETLNAEIAEVRKEGSEQLAQTEESSGGGDAPPPSQENIIAAAMRKAWSVRGQSADTDAWGVPASEEGQS